MLQSKLKNWVNAEVEKQLDKDGFFSLPKRMRIGIYLLSGSFVIGYGFPIMAMIIAGFTHHTASVLINSSIVYALSWVIGVAGLTLAGKDCIKYPLFFSAKGLKKLFPNYFREENDPAVRNKKESGLTPFQWATIFSIVGILLIIGLSSLFSSHLFFKLTVILIIFICGLHQALYIYGMFSPSSNFFFRSVKGKEFFHDQDGILFRFDDGPHPVYTPQILDILKAEGIQAFFAVTGKNAETYPEIVERMHRENHIIANHTYSHPCDILFLSYHRIKDEITRANAIIQNITGEEPEYFCTPVGFKNPIIGRVIKETGLIPVMWDIRTYDTRAPFEKIMAIIMRKLKSPAIIMFHDAIILSKNDREQTVLALKESIRILKEKKYL
jgi:Predicted xylanase/chitin deacetylase